MDEPGQKLKKQRESLGLKYRDVEMASERIAAHRDNGEYIIGLSRLADIENKALVPSIFRLYSLCAIYRLDLMEVMKWYGVDIANLVQDSTITGLDKTHLSKFGDHDYGAVLVPLALDPGLDLRKTTFVSRLIQKWGKLPLLLLNSMNLERHRYGFIGYDDWFLYPILHPGSLVLIDESRNKVVEGTWVSEFERPIYFLETRDGYACGWCYQPTPGQLVLHPHPSYHGNPLTFRFPEEAEIIGQVTGVAMRFNRSKKRQTRS
ncbi:MAG: hypothetical protein HYZ37_10610 [Candidatus Solibacter usitatus]|nr:hypothetical protein [Candidatus Solibacter usitatus]